MCRVQSADFGTFSRAFWIHHAMDAISIAFCSAFYLDLGELMSRNDRLNADLSQNGRDLDCIKMAMNTERIEILIL